MEFLPTEVFKIFFDESPDALFLVEPKKQSIVYCNSRAAELFEVPSKNDLIGKFDHEFHVEPYSKKDIKLVKAELDSNSIYRCEFQYYTATNNKFWAMMETKRIHLNNKFYQYVRLVDITNERQKLIDKEAQLYNCIREANHRIKNNLSIILSMIYLQMKDPEHNEQQSLMEVYSRISAVASLHDNLNSSEISDLNLKPYLLGLSDQIIALHPFKDHVEINRVIEDFHVENQVALNIGLILSELVSNSIKHAYNPDDDTNFIIIKILLLKNHLLFIYGDNGMQPNEIKGGGLGTEIIQILGEQIKGTIFYDKKGYFNLKARL